MVVQLLILVPHFFYSTSNGFIKVTSNIMKQSNNSIPISTIERNGKLSIINSSIEWNGDFDYRTSFGDVDFLQLQDVILNQNRLTNYLYKKK